MMQNILLVELNRNYYCFDDSKVKEKKLRFLKGSTEYIPSICQLVKIYFLPKTIRLEKGELKKHSGTRKS